MPWLLVLGNGAESGTKGWEGEGVKVGTASRGGTGSSDNVASVIEVVAAVSGGIGIDDASSVAFGVVGVDNIGCLVGFAVVVVSVGVEGVGGIGDASRAVGIGIVAASVAICSGGVEGYRQCQ